MTDDDQLSAALARHAIELPAEQIAQLDRFRAALWAWNEKLNLTRHTDYEKFVTRDVVDSLALEPFLEPGMRVLDVGTGGGVPGMILAIVRPDLEMTACDSVAKRARAAQAIAAESEIDVRVVHAPAQRLLEDEFFDALLARAVAPLPKLLRWFEPHWNSIGQLLLIKGRSWIDERLAAREAGLMHGLELRKLASYRTAGTGAESVILRIRPT